MDEDNIFDEDDAIDFIIYEELEAEIGKEKNKGGCLTGFTLFIAPFLTLIIGSYSWFIHR